MANRNTLFKFAGITVHTGGGTTRTKVRYGTDFVTRFKQLNNPKKIEDKRLGICLTPVRVELLELPEPMAKMDALRWLLTQPQFQSPEDQATIQDEIDNRTPRAPRVPRQKRDPSTVKVKMKASKKPSLDDIKARAPKSDVTVADVLKVAVEGV